MDRQGVAMDIKSVKLIIWDLDETFWNGTISEGGVDLSALNIAIVKKTSDVGIVNSICSKNDFAVVKRIDRDWNVGVFCFPVNRLDTERE